MEEWKEYRYTDIATLIGGGTPKTSNPSYWGGNIPWLSVKDFGNDAKYVYQTEKTITEEGLNNSSTKLLQKDDIIISARGTIGEMAMIPFPMSFNQSCFGIRGKENVDKDFLYYLTKTKINNLKSSSHGSVFDTITRATFDNIIVSLPPLPTQQKIANILSSLDDKIEVNRRINVQLEELAGALFKSWFVDFEPFKDGEFVDSELGMIPEGWKVGTLGDLCVTNKRTYGAKFINEIDYLDTGSVTKNQIEGFQILNPEVDKIPSRARRAVTEGDILFSSVRPNQKHYAFIFNPSSNMVASTGFIVITANWSGYRYFIYQYLIQEEIIDKLQTIAEQSVSTYPSINASDVTNLKLVIPPMDIIGKFAGMNLALMSEIDKNQQEITHLTTLRDTLLPKLMSGEIDVSEV